MLDTCKSSNYTTIVLKSVPPRTETCGPANTYPYEVHITSETIGIEEEKRRKPAIFPLTATQIERDVDNDGKE